MLNWLVGLVGFLVGVLAGEVWYERRLKKRYPMLYYNQPSNLGVTKGKTQFFEPQTNKERFDKANNITDLTNG